MTVITRLALRRRTPSSYGCVHVEALTSLLCAHGWYTSPPTNPTEYVRLTNERGQLLVLYHTGTVLVQGKHADDTHTQLAPLVTVGAA